MIRIFTVKNQNLVNLEMNMYNVELPTLMPNHKSAQCCLNFTHIEKSVNLVHLFHISLWCFAILAIVRSIRKHVSYIFKVKPF